MKYKTQTRFVIPLDEIIEYINERVSKSGYKKYEVTDVQCIMISFSDETKKADSISVLMKESKPLLF